MNKVVRIALADHSRQNTISIRQTLQQVANYRVMFEALNGQELFKKLSRNPVDIVLINFQMPIINSSKSLQEMMLRFPNLRIILMALYENPLMLWDYLSCGVNGLLLKHFNLQEISQTIEGVMEKGYHCSDTILRSISSIQTKSSKNKQLTFSSTELHIINGICAELKNSEMALQLFLSIRTIEWHRR